MTLVQLLDQRVVKIAKIYVDSFLREVQKVEWEVREPSKTSDIFEGTLIHKASCESALM